MINYRRLLRKLLILIGICAGCLLILFIAFYILVEYGGQWSDKKRQRFADDCAKTELIDNLYFNLEGFKPEEIDSILIKQIHEGKTIDSFYISPDINHYRRNEMSYSAQIDKPILIKDTYHFITKEQTFILSDMEMVMWAQYTMLSEGWGCVMGNYSINGVRFEHHANPTFVKESYE